MTTAASQIPHTVADTPPSFVLGHRPELDGLRGISILLVIALHLRLGLHGGFLGVDVFFVLSGFLITTLLVQEFSRTGSISLKEFYMRRLFRLGPALAVLVPLVCLFSIFTAQTREAFTGAWLTLSYVSNWFYAFKLHSADNPFGVTWSLAIEEQFYFAWPILLTVALKLKIRRRWMLSVLVILVGLIAVHRVSLAVHGASLDRMYFATDTRLDGILIGSIVGLLLSWGIVPRSGFPTAIVKLLALLGAFLLAFLVLTISSTSGLLYLGGFTIINLNVGLVLIALMLYPPKIIVTVLQWNPLVWIGKVSYGLYLWHWAVLKFIFPEDGAPSMGQLMSTVSLSFLFATLSYRYVEKPFLRLKDRRGNWRKGPVQTKGAAAYETTPSISITSPQTQ